MAKIDALFLTKTAKKNILLGRTHPPCPHVAILPPNSGSQLANVGVLKSFYTVPCKSKAVNEIKTFLLPGVSNEYSCAYDCTKIKTMNT